MNNCNHQFIEIRGFEQIYQGVVVCCPFCGQIRHLHEDGTVEIIIQTGKVTQKHENN